MQTKTEAGANAGSTYIDQSLQHHDVLLRNDPDAGYEYFWLNFKPSVCNTQSKLEHQLTDVSNQLNWCRSHREYDKIPNIIQRFLKGFFWDLLQSPGSSYHIRIACTNFKRWLKLCKLRSEYPVQGVTPYEPLEDQEMRYLYVCYRMYPDLVLVLKLNQLPIKVEDGKLYLLNMAISQKKPGMLNKLFEHYPDWTLASINKHYGASLPQGIKNGNKALKLLSQL